MSGGTNSSTAPRSLYTVEGTTVMSSDKARLEQFQQQTIRITDR